MLAMVSSVESIIFCIFANKRFNMTLYTVLLIVGFLGMAVTFWMLYKIPSFKDDDTAEGKLAKKKHTRVKQWFYVFLFLFLLGWTGCNTAYH
jgi:archaellum biogenesis protein FlaJ (TadC family)